MKVIVGGVSEKIKSGDWMGKRARVVILVSTGVGVLLLVGIGFRLMSKLVSDGGNPRGDINLAEILVPPKDAVDVRYSTPWDSKRVRHTYGLSFGVYDPYPSEATRTFIGKQLEANGWIRLEYDLLNPRVPAEWAGAALLHQFSADANEERQSALKEKFQAVRWQEDWLKNELEHIRVSGVYHVDFANRTVDPNRLHVTVTLFDHKSWTGPFIKRYKQLHPEEFADKAEQNVVGENSSVRRAK